jgi:6-pyruvoyl-tetrahydropterin synthase
LNDIPELSERNTTPEVIAQYLWQQIAPKLVEHKVKSMAVDVTESPTMNVRYEATLDDVG